jgi:hypothetical protein
MKKQIKKSNGSGILSGNPDTYLNIESIDGKDQVFLGNKPLDLIRKRTVDFEKKWWKCELSVFSEGNRVENLSPAHVYHLKKDDFSRDKNPFGLDPFPEEGIFVLTDSLGKIKWIVPDGPYDQITSQHNVDGSSIEDSDLPF